MHRWLVIFLALVSSAFSQLIITPDDSNDVTLLGLGLSIPGSGGGAGFSYYTSFEETGIPPGWLTDVPPPDWDNTDHAANGVQAAFMSAINTIAYRLISPPQPDSGFAVAVWKATAAGVGNSTPLLFRTQAGDGGPLLYLNPDNTLTVKLKDGVTATTVNPLNAGQWVWVKLRATSTTAFVAMSTTRNSWPASGDDTATATGTGGPAGDMFYWYHSPQHGTSIWIDDVKMQSGEPSYP